VAASSVAGLAFLICGIPGVLLAVHAVPPLATIGRTMLHPGALASIFTGPLDDGTVLHAIWLIAWAAWMWLTLCVAAEIVARLRGRSTRGLPGGRRVQSTMAFLVGASLALGPIGRQAAPLRLQVADAISSPSVPAVTLAASLSDSTVDVLKASVRSVSSKGVELVSAPMQSLPSSSRAVRTYVVVSGDTLWSIAEHQLGSPFQWRVIAEMNVGRPQPDGMTLTNDNWILPGWIFELPEGNVTSQVMNAESPGPVGPSHSDLGPGRGETSGMPHASRAAGRLEHAAPEAAEGRSVPSERKDDPTAPVETHHPVPFPIEAIGFGLLGAGIVALLDRMRRTQQRLRPTGLRIALPEGELAQLEHGLRVGSNPGSAEWIDLSLRLLSVIVRRHGITPPPVWAVRLRDDAVELLLDGEAGTEAPAPFEDVDDNLSWILPKAGPLLEQLRTDPEILGLDAPLPSLVTLGLDEHGLLMIDLERAASLSISGGDAVRLMESIAVELATAKWGDQIEVIMVGFDTDLDGLERVSRARSLSAVVTKMDRRIQERRALLLLAEHDSNVETRWADGGDAWDLCVVICAPSTVTDDVDHMRRLVDLAADGSLGVAGICGAIVPAARWRITAEGGRITVDSARLEPASLRAQPLPPGFAGGVSSLVAIAGRTDGVTPDEAPYDKLSMAIPDAPGDRQAGSERDLQDVEGLRVHALLKEGSVEVRVLGPVEIVGAARPFTRAWASELVVYLMMHPGGVSNEQWATALWPDKVMAPASLHSTASAARRSLGPSSTGVDHLPRSHGRLGLGPGVTSDWDQFVALSRTSDPGEWRRALALIRGRPFDGLRSPDWVLLEGIAATVEAVVVDLACRYAEFCLSVADPAGAEWAARQGLRVSAYDERLYRVRLRAADAAGNPAGVETVMAELVRLVADGVEPFDAVHPETLSLYRALSRRALTSRFN